ncbi:hypothetical protein cypCar_00006057 [Cyprinus carpio]|nr:hypothetical protein cypCar_00006057 [Cyprinus carpio]
MPPLKSPAAFHEQMKSLERARTEDYLKRKIRSRPERSELVRMHILEETSAEPSLQAKQLKLKRARLADDLNDKISHRPGPIELIHKNIIPVHTLIGTESPKGESSSMDEDSSDALSPDPLCSQDSPLGLAPQHSPSDMLKMNGELSPSQFLTQAPPPPLVASDASPPRNLTSETNMTNSSRPPTGHTKQSKSSTDRTSQRSKKPKDNKPKVKKLKYHQYIPPDQKNDREPPPELDSSYAKILHQQQLFLQLQIINQQQQHYNYHTILPAPPKLPAEKQQPSNNPGPSPSRTISACSTISSHQNGPNRQSQPTVGGAKPSTLPANLDEFKVAELKHELKLRGLTVSGTKNDLIERLKNYQEQNSGSSATGTAATKTVPAQVPQVSVQSSGAAQHQAPKDTVVPLSAFPVAATTRVHSTTPPQIMRFSSTSSSPPASPTPSDRSLAGLSPDEASCNGDVFGEMVSSPLTQLSLHPSPDRPSPIKEESHGQMQPSCRLSHPGPLPAAQSQDPGPMAASGSAVSPLDKDQMLQEKDKQIEELTRMLRQKQRLVETLRSQLEQAHSTPTLVTDSNGNRYLIALTSNSVDSLTGKSPQSKSNGWITLQVQKVGLHLETPIVKEPSQPVSAPPSFEPFFSEESNPLSKPSSPPSFKDNVSNNQQIDDLFEILIKSGEISSGFKASQDPSLSDLPSSPPTPSPPPSPHHFLPPTHHPDTQNRPCSGTGRLEDFLESTTGAPLLGVEPDGPLTLIDDLHNQMLSTSSILDHPSSPMDTSDLSFSPHPASLDFEDPTLDGMDWLDIPVVGGGSNSNSGGMVLAPLSSHTPPSVFSADFLDSSDLQLHWDSCL